MEKEEKVRGSDVKKEEFLGLKLKRGMFVGKRGGNSTPSPTWRFGLTQTEGSKLQDFTFPSNFTTTISARKLGANLWEVQPHQEVVKMSKGTPPKLHQHHKHKEKDEDNGFELLNDVDQPLQSPKHQPTTASDLRKYAQSMMQHDHSVEGNGHALPPVSPGNSSSTEMTPYRPAITPTGTLRLKGRLKESGCNLKTSTELLKVLNRIWSLEEQHSSNIALVKALKKELDHARAQIKQLLHEKKRHRQEMDDMMRQLAEDKVTRKYKVDDQIQDAIQSMRNELEDERKLRKYSESLQRKLARELSDVKSSLSNALKELERESKARILLEDLCDEFAKGIRDYEQEIRLRKNKSEKDWYIQEHTDRLILHISEAWLDERMQMKLAETCSGLVDKKTIVDKLSMEIETFLQTKKSGSCVNDDVLSSKLPTGSNLRRYSLESFHLNEPGSAPQNGNDEEDYVDSGLCCSELNRRTTQKRSNGSTKQHIGNDPNGTSQKQSNGSTKQHTENDPNGYLAKAMKLNHIKQKSSDGVSCNGNETCPVNTEPAQTRVGDPVGLNITRDPCLSSEGKQHHEDNHVEGHFDPSSFTGPARPVEKWTSKAPAPDPEASEPSSRWHQGIKENTLKAKLLEARLESRQSRSRASKGP